MGAAAGPRAEFLSLAGNRLIGPAQSWRRGVQADLIEQRLARQRPPHQGVCVVHNEPPPRHVDIAAVRRAIDARSTPPS